MRFIETKQGRKCELSFRTQNICIFGTDGEDSESFIKDILALERQVHAALSMDVSLPDLEAWIKRNKKGLETQYKAGRLTEHQIIKRKLDYDVLWFELNRNHMLFHRSNCASSFSNAQKNAISEYMMSFVGFINVICSMSEAPEYSKEEKVALLHLANVLFFNNASLHIEVEMKNPHFFAMSNRDIFAIYEESPIKLEYFNRALNDFPDQPIVMRNYDYSIDKVRVDEISFREYYALAIKMDEQGLKQLQPYRDLLIRDEDEPFLFTSVPHYQTLLECYQAIRAGENANAIMKKLEPMRKEVKQPSCDPLLKYEFCRLEFTLLIDQLHITIPHQALRERTLEYRNVLDMKLEQGGVILEEYIKGKEPEDVLVEMTLLCQHYVEYLRLIVLYIDEFTLDSKDAAKVNKMKLRHDELVLIILRAQASKANYSIYFHKGNQDVYSVPVTAALKTWLNKQVKEFQGFLFRFANNVVYHPLSAQLACCLGANTLLIALESSRINRKDRIDEYKENYRTLTRRYAQLMRDHKNLEPAIQFEALYFQLKGMYQLYWFNHQARHELEKQKKLKDRIFLDCFKAHSLFKLIPLQSINSDCQILLKLYELEIKMFELTLMTDDYLNDGLGKMRGVLEKYFALSKQSDVDLNQPWQQIIDAFQNARFLLPHSVCLLQLWMEIKRGLDSCITRLSLILEAGSPLPLSQEAAVSSQPIVVKKPLTFAERVSLAFSQSAIRSVMEVNSADTLLCFLVHAKHYQTTRNHFSAVMLWYAREQLRTDENSNWREINRLPEMMPFFRLSNQAQLGLDKREKLIAEDKTRTALQLKKNKLDAMTMLVGEQDGYQSASDNETDPIEPLVERTSIEPASSDPIELASTSSSMSGDPNSGSPTTPMATPTPEEVAPPVPGRIVYSTRILGVPVSVKVNADLVFKALLSDSEELFRRHTDVLQEIFKKRAEYRYQSIKRMNPSRELISQLNFQATHHYCQKIDFFKRSFTEYNDEDVKQLMDVLETSARLSAQFIAIGALEKASAISAATTYFLTAWRNQHSKTLQPSDHVIDPEISEITRDFQI